MIPPTDIGELRRVMGLLVQHKDTIPWYATEAMPLHRLTRKGVEWQWTDAENNAFEFLRSACLKNTILCPPDYSKEVIVATDASNDGKGGMVYQLKDVNGPDCPDNRCIIRYFSKAWDNAMRCRPPFYKEADAAITGATIAAPYALATPYPLRLKTDQAPLRFLAKCTRGPLVPWRLENLGGVPFTVEYIPGKLNVAPDALSRYPMLGPKRLTRVGVDSALETLTSVLPDAAKDARRLWFWAGRDTSMLARRLQQWRNPTNAILTRSPRTMFNHPWDMAIIIPGADQATAVARKAIASKRPAAIFVPTDLVPYIAQNQDETFDQDLADAVTASRKVSLCAPLMTWLIVGDVGVAADAVFAGETQTQPPDTTSGWTAAVGTLEQWIDEQKSSAAAESISHLSR